jgi:antitoxin PrlF
MAKKRSSTTIEDARGCCGGDCEEDCACRSPAGLDGCRVEAIVRLDARGQMVLPKDVRERAGFRPDEKLAVVSWQRGNQVCCVALQRADDLAEVVRQRFGPLLTAHRPET